jgi:hypothetical protein
LAQASPCSHEKAAVLRRTGWIPMIRPEGARFGSVLRQRAVGILNKAEAGDRVHRAQRAGTRAQARQSGTGMDSGDTQGRIQGSFVQNLADLDFGRGIPRADV